jgi:DNA invertase Pin-like site-specific DNA recombinase
MSKDTDKQLRLTGDGAAYIRVSDDQQDTLRQYNDIHGFEERHGVTIPPQRWFKDHGWARDTADDRPEFQRLMKLAEAGRIRWIVVSELDHFGVKSAKQLTVYLYRLDEAGCKLYDSTGKEWTGEDDSTELQAWVRGKQSAREQRDKSPRTLSGHVKRAEDGECQGGPSPFGLDKACYSRAEPDKEMWRVVYQGGEVIDRRPDKRGKMKNVYSLFRVKVYPDGREERWDGPDNHPPHNKKTEERRLTPSRDQAKLDAVREVFRTFAEQAVGFSDLARLLTERSFRTAYGDKFQPVHIARMLENDAYMGHYAYGRRHSGKFHRHTDGQVTPDLNYGEKESKSAREDWVVSDRLLFEPLIDAEIWEGVQQKLKHRQERPRTPRLAYEYLNGLLFCGNCGEQKRPRGLKKGEGVRSNTTARPTTRPVAPDGWRSSRAGATRSGRMRSRSTSSVGWTRPGQAGTCSCKGSRRG